MEQSAFPGMMADPPGTAFRFADLLPELRDSLYEYYLATEPEGSMIDVSKLHHKQPNLNLALVCRQIAEELFPRWRAAKELFWQTHKFFLDSNMLPNSKSFTIGQISMQKTMFGYFDLKTYELSDLTHLGNQIKELDRLFIGPSLEDCQTTILVSGAVDRQRIKETERWYPNPLSKRINVVENADRYWARRTQKLALVSKMDVLQGLSAFLVYRDLGMCVVTGAREGGTHSVGGRGDIPGARESRLRDLVRDISETAMLDEIHG